jgi:hypothetical protein
VSSLHDEAPKLSRSLRQARIEPEALQLSDAKLSKAFVRRVDEEVGFGSDHGTGTCRTTESPRASHSSPIVLVAFGAG